jgi:hypothetical protein
LLSQLDLNLLPHVEYGTVAAGAKNLLVERPLASLALGPQPGKLLFLESMLRKLFFFATDGRAKQSCKFFSFVIYLKIKTEPALATSNAQLCELTLDLACKY